MKLIAKKKLWLVVVLLVIAFATYLFFIPEKKVDFSADVKPILNKKCITCHGGVRAKAGFSVLFREEALANTKSGKPAIIPGDPEHSELIRRISSHDPEERMPYKHEALSKGEISILTKWIRQGAKWGDHWAYLPLKEVKAPDIENKWVRNDVDKFILQKIKEEKLTPSPATDKAALLRRVSLDLIGMYPSSAVASKFLASGDDNAYNTLVDSLLASPHFGERWASMWLDLARYADTKGYESDGNRNIWAYRDWVIKAFNEDKPYDKFLTEQIAGDLLPDPTDDQYIATAFSRNSMTNDEGGTNNEEFRTAAVMDRVSTTWEGLMSTTFACVQCHSHPYDPFHHDEYYKFLAYFNNTRDEDVPAEYPLLREFNDSAKRQIEPVTQWIQAHATPTDARKASLFLRTWQPSINSTSADSLENAVIVNNNVSLFYHNHGRGRLKHVDLANCGQLILNFYSNTKGGVMKVHRDSPDGPLIVSYPVKPMNKWRMESIEFPRQEGIHDIYVRYENDMIPTNDDFPIQFDWFAFLPAFPGKGEAGYEANKKKYWEMLNAELPTTPVMVENPGAMWRKSHVFERGNWRTLGKEVEPAVPASLNFAMPTNAPKNRLGLAMWLTDKRNPLVARTITNRLWEQLFGAGITETLEDMGTQGIPPTHKELLDYLSWKLMTDYKWSLKKLLRELVTSATYRQESKLTPEGREKDFNNKFYARGPRVRLSAEQLRDQDLCISGALSTKMYGPGVMPWQPDGIWLSPYNGSRWKSSEGDDQYRRAVYTYWKRTSPYPSMISFDGAQRVACSARRIRTNTPLQALVTLNDSVYLDMARHFAGRMRKEGGATIAEQVAKGYEMMLYKPITRSTLKIFEDLYATALDEFKKDKEKASGMLGKNEEVDTSAAALVVVANAMLNLDEIITKN
ncbi:MAG TPA: DUF1553 domain-containing protein [Chitinophagaceae bacterium]|nr:DUF1553 domain-containing protein [Chitinophagaceae bacterium]